LGEIIASWLAPGSPPKFLPELDIWGKEAAEVWAQGFASADLSAFNSLNSSITAFVKSGGSMDSSLVTNYIGALYGARDANAALVAAQGNERDMNAALTAAQENLNRVTSQYDAILNPLKNQLSAAQNKKTEADDAVKIMDLQRIANDTSINQMERNKAAAEIDVIKTQEKVNKVQLEKDIAVQAAQVKVEAARAEEAAAKMSLEAARQAAEFAKNNLDMQKEALDLATKQQELAQQADKGGAGAGGGLGAGLKMPGGGLSIKTPENPLADFAASVNTKVAEIMRSIDRFISDIQTALKNAWNPVAPFWSEAWTRLKGIVDTNMPVVKGNVQTGLDNMKEFWQKHKGEVEIIVGTLWVYINQQLSGAMLWAASITTFGLDIVSGIWAAFWLAVNGKIDLAIKTIQDSFWNGLGAIAKLTGQNLDDIKQSWVTISDDITQFVSQSLLGLRGFFTDAFTFIVSKARQFGIDAMVHFNKLVADAQAAFAVQKWIDLGKSILDGIGKGIKDNMDAVAGRAIEAARAIIENIKKSLGISSPSTVFAEIGQNMMEGMALGISMNANVPSLAAAGAVSNIVQTTNYGGNSYNYSPSYGSAPNQPSTDFSIMQVMAG
jgi:hypothetical protein